MSGGVAVRSGGDPGRFHEVKWRQRPAWVPLPAAGFSRVKLVGQRNTLPDRLYFGF